MAAASAIQHDIARTAPGGFTIAVLWGLLQYVGTIYVSRVLAATGEMEKIFGVVLGLIGLLYIGAIMGVLGIEVNVVLAEKLWPRALMTPFTDQVDLTEADRKAYAMYATSQRHKGFQTVAVRFDGRDGDSHEIVLDPRTEEIIRQRIPAAPPPPDPAAPDALGADSAPDKPDATDATDATQPIRQPHNLPPSG
jgi:hypothetical protein